jgi:hypothetical protein
MTTYADPTRCPDCRAVLPQAPQACPICSLPLTGETAVSLFQTFLEADALLATLRKQRQPAPVPATVGAPVGTRLEGIAPYPTSQSQPRMVTDRPRQMRGSSVPRILLSLGALCLLVAAVTFLAVAWSWLGVGGRTAVLVGLTVVSIGLSVTMLRRGLRTAAEALSVVGLGLVALDVVGSRHAGWLGSIDDTQLTLVTGAVVATAALGLLVASAESPLVAPALLTPIGVLVAGTAAQASVDTPLPMVVALLVLLATARIGTVLPSLPLQVTSTTTGTLAWLYVVAAGVDHAGSPITVVHYFGDLACWPLVVAVAVAAATGPITGVRRIDLPGYAVAGLVGTFAALLPVADNSPTATTSVLTAAAAVWVGLVMVAPDRFRPAALLPLGGALVVPTVAAARLLAASMHAATAVGPPFSRPFDVPVSSAATEVSALLLLPMIVTIAAAGCALTQLAEPVGRTVWARALGGAAVLGLFATLPLYDVPLAVIVGILVATAVVCMVGAERMTGRRAGIARTAALALTSLGALLALPSDIMLTGVLALGCVMAAYLMSRTDTTGAVADLCFPIGLAGLFWAGGNVVGIDEQYRAVPVLLALGVLAIWRPEPELEASCALAGTLVSAASVVLAPDLSLSLAVHLTIAGALVTTSSIVHESRRMLAWPGGLLLAAATWVRLADLGVDVVEAYTLPSAMALVAVGAWRLRDGRSATMTALAPGLALATVPSLLATVDDPYSVRALLLGAACVGLAVAGAALRWTAPLVVGSVVGALLVLLELAPYAAEVPTWVTIGISGALLLLVGITWESRMNDVRRASSYLVALR